MKSLVQEREKAINLRRKGYSYKEICKELGVAKSSLSLWFKNLPLTDDEKRHLKSSIEEKMDRGRIRAATTRKMNTAINDGFLFRDSKREFEELSKDPLFHIGVALYWAEGAKRNTYFAFMNSDPEMINLMVRWARRFLGVPIEEIGARLYIHLPFASEQNEHFWSKTSGVPLDNFRKTVYKRNSALVKRRPDYKGCLRIEITKVKYLKKMKFFQKLLIEHYKEKG